ncbi:MAG: hypothetical protein C4520_01040 [Candidatus Abyssobacteria bacterium SURF_5]|uniref:Uncharacterized protein n=1 Tax=Abyssobacteria bacterium (strain SURF_5) TaxID=2093360 RepID=A0A3A4P0C0_ABYX5|nr:MAG: hypothetical protein C4520_01040 [Candidatus Abyssubacteria bacterium SURF_5]
MGWLFALSLGLQQKSGRAIWVSLVPISAGHATSIALVAVLVAGIGSMISLQSLRLLTAVTLLGFGVYKLITYYRHPKWVGMRVKLHDLFLWSFLMAFAHGAGLMIAPILVGLLDGSHSGTHHVSASSGMLLMLAIVVHTLAMLVVMGFIAWIVYTRLGLMFLRRSWVNFDLIWAGALLVVGALALWGAVAGGGMH